MAANRTSRHSFVDEAAAAPVAATPGIPPRAIAREAHSYVTAHHIRHFRSASNLVPESHRRMHNGSPLVREQRSSISLKAEQHLQEQRSQVQQLQRQRAGTYSGRENATNEPPQDWQLVVRARQHEAEKSKFFVRSSTLPSSSILTRGPILSNAVFSNPSGKLYEFVFPPCYKPVLLRPSFWQKGFKFPEYHVVLLDSERYALEPIVVLREAHEFASPDGLSTSTGKDERALHIASCYRDQVVLTVQSELQKRSKYCADGLEKAQKIKKKHYEADRDVAKRNRMRRNHKLMQIAADCAGDNGARGATWLFDRLIRYFEFIGKKDGDEVVLRAGQLLVNDIQSTARQTDISLAWLAEDGATA